MSNLASHRGFDEALCYGDITLHFHHFIQAPPSKPSKEPKDLPDAAKANTLPARRKSESVAMSRTASQPRASPARASGKEVPKEEIVISKEDRKKILAEKEANEEAALSAEAYPTQRTEVSGTVKR